MSITEIIQTILETEGSAFFYTPPIHGDAVSYVFDRPSVKIQTKKYEELIDCLARIDGLRSDYPIGYGYIAYEAGYQFEDALHKYRNSGNKNLLSFSFYDGENFKRIVSSEIDHTDMADYLESNSFSCSDLDFETTENKYIENIIKIKKYIEEGDTYQVNYTLKSVFEITGDPAALILNIIFNQSAKYVAIINDAGNIIISSSPELFFQVMNNEIICRPMKGTIKRGKNIGEDAEYSRKLSQSDKDRAENVMIVDLLRNDVGRIAEIDSVSAESRYNIEKYESVYQMTSEIRGRLRDTGFVDIIRNIYPCGSITGAPKISTMKIIKEIENSGRGIYTGAIGLLRKESMIFNVPIRTIEIDTKMNKGCLGLGSGVVWESDPAQEYSEVKLKGEFLTNPVRYFEMIESMLIEDGTVFLLDYHLNRLKHSADFFLFKYDETQLKKYLDKILKTLDVTKKYKLRLTLDKWGNFNHSLDEITSAVSGIDICISAISVSSGEKFLYFKTTNRDLYDTEFNRNHEKGFGETIFLNENENITEGCRTNIFIGMNNKLYTPPVEDGLLDGCYRKYLLDRENKSEEKSLTLNDLLKADYCVLVNSVRKEIAVKRIFRNGVVLKEY